MFWGNFEVFLPVVGIETGRRNGRGGRLRFLLGLLDFLLLDLVVLLDNVVQGLLRGVGDTSKFQACCSRMLAATERSSMEESSHSRRICSICSGSSHSKSIRN